MPASRETLRRVHRKLTAYDEEGETPRRPLAGGWTKCGIDVLWNAAKPERWVNYSCTWTWTDVKNRMRGKKQNAKVTHLWQYNLHKKTMPRTPLSSGLGKFSPSGMGFSIFFPFLPLPSLPPLLPPLLKRVCSVLMGAGQEAISCILVMISPPLPLSPRMTSDPGCRQALPRDPASHGLLGSVTWAPAGTMPAA